jgi:uridine kinase
MRRKNIKHVGLGEVDLKRLDSDVGTFRLEKSERITKPVVIFAEDRITRETIDPNQFKVGIVEGTYAALLNQVTRRIFIARTYEDTRQDRHARRREKQDHFIEMVLEIEHGIISRHLSMADIIVERDHSVRVVTKETQTE